MEKHREGFILRDRKNALRTRGFPVSIGKLRLGSRRKFLAFIKIKNKSF